MHTVIIKGSFTTEEAAIIKAKNRGTKENTVSLCDRNGFNMVSWGGKTVVVADTDKDDKLTPYMLKQAIKLGAKQAK